MPCSRSAASPAAASPSSTSQAAKAHPGVVEVMTPANRPPLAQDPDAKTQPVHVPARCPAERPGALRQPADRGGDRRDAGGRDGRRGAAVAALRGRAGPHRPRRRRKLRARRPSASASRPRRSVGDVEAGLAAASQRIDATYETPAQYHNAMEPHAIVAAWDGDTLSIDTPSQALAMAQGRIAGLFGIAAGEDPYPQPVPRRRLRLQGPDLRAAGPRHPGGAAGRPAGQARAAPRADVRPGRPSRADPPDASARHRRRGPADRDRPSRQDGVEHLRRFLRAGRRRLAYALRQPCDRDLARGRAASIPARRCSCARPARRPDRSRSKAPSTRRPGPAGWIRSSSA